MKPFRSLSRTKKFDYQNLEPRHMLSGNLPAIDAQVELARSFLGSSAETQYLVQGNSDVQFVEAKQEHGSTTFLLQQTSHGIPVYGTYLTVVQDDHGHFHELKGGGHVDLITSAVEFPQVAQQVAEQAANAEFAGQEFTTSSQLAWTESGQLVWQVDTFLGTVTESYLPADFSTIVDVHTGNILAQETPTGVTQLLYNPSTTTGLNPRIVINDTIGPAGSRTYASTFDSVVALPGCTGTLIASNVIISARHCGSSTGDSIRFGEDSNNPDFTATVASVLLPGGAGSFLDGGDVSILTLTADVPANIATPMKLIDLSNGLETMLSAMIGYGLNGVGSTGHQGSADGFRWGGENIIDVYGAPAGGFSGINIISTDFDDGTAGANTIPAGDSSPLTFEATTAPGDSGGPILVQFGTEWVVAGVLSGGTTSTSVYGDISWWTGVQPFRAEIEAAGGVFAEGNISFDQENYDSGDTVTVTLDGLSSTAPTIDVTVISNAGDSETITLNAVGTGEVVFNLQAQVDPFNGNNRYADVWGDGDYAYVGSFAGSGVAIFDVSDPTSTFLAGSYTPGSGGQFKDVKVINGIGYFASDNGGGLHIVDVVNPAAPILLSQITSSNGGGFNSIHNISVSGNFLYQVDSRSPRVKVFDISDSSNPFFVRNIDTTDPRFIHDITALGNRLYTSGFGGKTDIYDTSNISTSDATLLGSINSGSNSHSSWASADGNLLVSARERGNGDVRLYDISDPSNPVLRSSITRASLGINAHSPHNVIIDGDRLYISWYQAGLQVLDISDPSNPTRIGYYDTFPGGAGGYDGNWGVYPFLGNDRILLSDTDGGLFVINTVVPDYVGNIVVSTGNVMTEDGMLQASFGGTITVSFGSSSSDTAMINQQVIVGTNGNDVIEVEIGSLVRIVVNGDEFFINSSVQNSLFFDALLGEDKITITDGAGNEVTTLGDSYVDVRGFFNFSAVSVEDVTVNSGGGFDIARMNGTDRDDIFASYDGKAIFSGQEFKNTVNGYDRVIAVATPGGFDRASFVDTPGSDRFFANSTTASMTSNGSYVRASGFSKVTAHATEGGFDVATFAGTAGNDELYASPRLANIRGAGYEINAAFFERTSSNGGGGFDTANLVGSDGNDIYFSKPEFGYLYGAGYFSHAVNFDRVTAHAKLGNDRANMWDSPGTDSFFATPAYAVLMNSQYRTQANGFDRVSAFGTAGFNSAVLLDSAGFDRFIARPGDAYMIGNGFLNYTKGFNSVRAISSGGGDIAILHDSREDDRLFGSKNVSILTGTTFYNRAENFRRVTAYFTKGVDRARFVDSSGNDTFIAKGIEASLFSDDYFVFAVGLDVVTAVSENGGTDLLAKLNPEFVLIEQGNWNS